MGKLDGRVIVITGAGGGIGAAVAKALAAHGASVVVNDLGVAVDGTGASSAPAQRVVDDITKAGGTAVANGADVADHHAAEGLIQSAIENFGKLDVLINAAGILRARMVFNMTEDEWDAVIRVHLKGTFNTTKFASAYWRELRKESAHHRLINFTSAAGLFGSSGQPNYSAAKLGIVGFTFSCANALGRYGVTANALSPSANTRMIETIPEDRLRPGADYAAPEHIAPILIYLASEQSDWLNGHVLGASGYQVTLYSNPAPLCQIVSDGPWDIDHLFTAVEESFKGDPRLRRT